MTYRTAVALGSNLGDRCENLRRAVDALTGLGRVVAVSSLYETAPMGGPEQGAYLNAVAVLSTPREPEDLLGELLEIEDRAGRVRVERWGPRSLDLDLITAVDETGAPVRVETERLQVPHPRAHLRRFVLAPLAEVWPQAPLQGGSAAGYLARVDEDQEVEALGRDWTSRRLGTARAYLGSQGFVFLAYAAALAWTGRRPLRPGLLTVAGATTAAAGGALTAWGVASLGPAASPYPEPRPGTELTVHGPYRYLRHPIYSGLVLATAGLAVWLRSWPGLAVSALIGWFFSSKARYEESRLRLAVPGYAAYQRKVRGRLIPGAIGPTRDPGSC